MEYGFETDCGSCSDTALTFLLPHTLYIIMLAMHKNHAAHVCVCVHVHVVCECMCVGVCACVHTSTHTHTRTHLHTHTYRRDQLKIYNFIISILYQLTTFCRIKVINHYSGSIWVSVYWHLSTDIDKVRKEVLIGISLTFKIIHNSDGVTLIHVSNVKY